MKSDSNISTGCYAYEVWMWVKNARVTTWRRTIYWLDPGRCLQFSGVGTRQRAGPLSFTAHLAYWAIRAGLPTNSSLLKNSSITWIARLPKTDLLEYKRLFTWKLGKIRMGCNKNKNNSYRHANLVAPSDTMPVIWINFINNFLDDQKHLVAFRKHLPWFFRATKAMIERREKAANPVGANKRREARHATGTGIRGSHRDQGTWGSRFQFNGTVGTRFCRGGGFWSLFFTRAFRRCREAFVLNKIGITIPN